MFVNGPQRTEPFVKYPLSLMFVACTTAGTRSTMLKQVTFDAPETASVTNGKSGGSFVTVRWHATPGVSAQLM